MTTALHRRVTRLGVATPFQTLRATPLVSTFRIDALVTLSSVRVVIPKGHAGITGVRLRSQGRVLLPWAGASTAVDNDADRWLVGDDADWLFDMGDVEVAPIVTVETYNLDAIIHRHEMHLTTVDIPVSVRAAAVGAI